MRVFGILQGRLTTELTLEYFILEQAVYSDGRLLKDHLLVQTSPREGVFFQYLGDLVIGKDMTIIYKRRDRVLSSFDLRISAFVSPTPVTPYT